MQFLPKLEPRIRDVLMLAPIPFAMVLLHPNTAWAMFMVVSFIALHEWRRIVCQTRERLYTFETRLAFFGLIIAMILALYQFELAILAVLAFAYFAKIRGPVLIRSDLALGQLVVGMVAILAYFLRSYPGAKADDHVGLALFGLVLVLTIFSDSAAYFIGKQFGKHPLAPIISPKKTWEGAIAGWVFGVLAAVIYCNWVAGPLDDLHILIQIILFWGLVIASQLGDLGESWLKRKYGVKDSGVTLRSHGGVLDRFDSIGPVLVLLCLGLWVLF